MLRDDERVTDAAPQGAHWRLRPNLRERRRQRLRRRCADRSPDALDVKRGYRRDEGDDISDYGEKSNQWIRKLLCPGRYGPGFGGARPDGWLPHQTGGLSAVSY